MSTIERKEVRSRVVCIIRTLAISRGLTRIAERKAAPAAEKALSPKPKLASESCWGLGASFASLKMLSALPSKSTLVAAALIHEGIPCRDPTISISRNLLRLFIYLYIYMSHVFVSKSYGVPEFHGGRECLVFALDSWRGVEAPTTRGGHLRERVCVYFMGFSWILGLVGPHFDLGWIMTAQYLAKGLNDVVCV